MRFTVLYSRSPNGKGYWAMVPGLAGCFSAGDTFEDAEKNVNEAIELHVLGMLEDGEELPNDGEFIVGHADLEVGAKAR